MKSLHPSHPSEVQPSVAAAALYPSAAVEILLHLAVRAHQNVDRADDVDYWYRLGQRNAYLQSAAQVTCLNHGTPALEVSDRLGRALEEGCVDVPTLAGLASTDAPPNPDRKAPELDWLGPQAFKARYAGVRGTDHDYGMRWGSRSDQRISHRRIEAAQTGALFAYDATWDEYALIGLDVPTAAVERAFQRALDSDIHMSAGEFARLVTLQIGPSADAHSAGPEL